MRMVIALGGNAMTAPGGRARPEDQRAAVEQAMGPIAELVVAGHEVVLTHGNGPQVGNLLVKNELAASVVPPVPLDWCVAQTQATIGVLVLNAAQRALAAYGRAPRVASLVTRVRVDPHDAGFLEPSKPIGRFLPGDQAAVMTDHGQVWREVDGRGWRRLVASPEPLAVLDLAAVRALVADGQLVVCAGGGGVPVVPDGEHGWRGVEAVVDKDLTAALLAAELDADLLVIATDVEAAVAGFGTPHARPIGATTPHALRSLAAEHHFAGGSMGPKVEAACRFAESAPGRRAVITSLRGIGAAVDGSAGTSVRVEE